MTDAFSDLVVNSPAFLFGTDDDDADGLAFGNSGGHRSSKNAAIHAHDEEEFPLSPSIRDATRRFSNNSDSSAVSMFFQQTRQHSNSNSNNNNSNNSNNSRDMDGHGRRRESVDSNMSAQAKAQRKLGNFFSLSKRAGVATSLSFPLEVLSDNACTHEFPMELPSSFPAAGDFIKITSTKKSARNKPQQSHAITQRQSSSPLSANDDSPAQQDGYFSVPSPSSSILSANSSLTNSSFLENLTLDEKSPQFGQNTNTTSTAPPSSAASLLQPLRMPPQQQPLSAASNFSDDDVTYRFHARDRSTASSSFSSQASSEQPTTSVPPTSLSAKEQTASSSSSSSSSTSTSSIMQQLLRFQRSRSNSASNFATSPLSDVTNPVHGNSPFQQQQHQQQYQQEKEASPAFSFSNDGNSRLEAQQVSKSPAARFPIDTSTFTTPSSQAGTGETGNSSEVKESSATPAQHTEAIAADALRQLASIVSTMATSTPSSVSTSHPASSARNNGALSQAPTSSAHSPITSVASMLSALSNSSSQKPHHLAQSLAPLLASVTSQASRPAVENNSSTASQNFDAKAAPFSATNPVSAASSPSYYSSDGGLPYSPNSATPSSANGDGSVAGARRRRVRKRVRKRMKDLNPEQQAKLREMNRLAAQKHREGIKCRQTTLDHLLSIQDIRRSNLEAEQERLEKELKTLHEVAKEFVSSGRMQARREAALASLSMAARNMQNLGMGMLQHPSLGNLHGMSNVGLGISNVGMHMGMPVGAPPPFSSNARLAPIPIGTMNHNLGGLVNAPPFLTQPHVTQSQNQPPGHHLHPFQQQPQPFFHHHHQQRQ